MGGKSIKAGSNHSSKCSLSYFGWQERAEWGQMTPVLDSGSSTEYHHLSYGRVRVPVDPPDFKNDSGGIRLRQILSCWTASGFLFLHLQILMV
jgi:hypothetical protein